MTSSPEAGGLVLGRLVESSTDVIVDEISTPVSSDRWSRFNFCRGKKTAQRKVDKAWAESSGTRIYLGEWHTHPEDVPTPSDHDLRDWQRIVQGAQYEQEGLFFVIVGRQQMRVWEYAKGSKPTMLQAEERS